MIGPDNVVRAFSEDHVERLTGLTKAQLRYWDKTGFFSPTYADEPRRRPYSRVYSFRDVVGLKTLGILRNHYEVPLQHLRQVAAQLSHLADNLWTSTILYVLKKRVIFEEEGTGRLRDVVSGQYVNGLALKAVMADVTREADELRQRSPQRIGQIVRHRNVARNAWVVAGTRIPVRAIKRFHEAGFTPAQIIQEYPDLTEADIKAALEHEDSAAA
jgi:uncharacterized protein (DUF433 family)